VLQAYLPGHILSIVACVLCCHFCCRNQPGPWQHMFSNKQQLSALTALRTVDAWTWWPSDLDRLVSSCCNLQYLSMCCSTGLQLTRLLQLTALTQLWAAGVTQGSTTASLVQLSALQGLQDLILMQPCRFADNDAVRSLTALTQLTRLGLSDKDGVFSAAMQQQLLQQFDQDKVQGAGREKFHNIIDTVSTFCCGCTVQHCLQNCCGYACFDLPWFTVCNDCTCLTSAIRPQPLCHQPHWFWCSPTLGVVCIIVYITHTLPDYFLHATLPHHLAPHNTCPPPLGP